MLRHPSVSRPARRNQDPATSAEQDLQPYFTYLLQSKLPSLCYTSHQLVRRRRGQTEAFYCLKMCQRCVTHSGTIMCLLKLLWIYSTGSRSFIHMEATTCRPVLSLFKTHLHATVAVCYLKRLHCSHKKKKMFCSPAVYFHE